MRTVGFLLSGWMGCQRSTSGCFRSSIKLVCVRHTGNRVISQEIARYKCRGWEGEAEAKTQGGKETEGLEKNGKKQTDADKETEKEKESEMEGPRQREKHTETESGREGVRQKETTAEKIRETDRQARERSAEEQEKMDR